jgi:DNA-binding transcriptional regulator YiaG
MNRLTLIKGLSEAEAHIQRHRKGRKDSNANPQSPSNGDVVQPSLECGQNHEELAFDERVRHLRKRLGLSQAQFSERYGLPLRTVQNWEQARRTNPDASGKLLIGLIERNPEGMAVLVETLQD